MLAILLGMLIFMVFFLIKLIYTTDDEFLLKNSRYLLTLCFLCFLLILNSKRLFPVLNYGIKSSINLNSLDIRYCILFGIGIITVLVLNNVLYFVLENK